jgi:hypothetical protein
MGQELIFVVAGSSESPPQGIRIKTVPWMHFAPPPMTGLFLFATPTSPGRLGLRTACSLSLSHSRRIATLRSLLRGSSLLLFISEALQRVAPFVGLSPPRS